MTVQGSLIRLLSTADRNSQLTLATCEVMRTLLVLIGLSLSTAAFAEGPQFDCTNKGGKDGEVRATLVGSDPVDEKKLVTVHIWAKPSDKQPSKQYNRDVCGSAFKTDKTQTVTFPWPDKMDKATGHITCKAFQSNKACGKS